MTQAKFDAVIHEPTRLQICGILAAVTEAEFSTLRDTIGIADSVTSKHLKTLEGAGYVRMTKRGFSGRPRTWARLTTAGRTAFAGHLAELRRLASITTPED
ncbi:transcriptional regulator [Nocardioides euryhalodurans]|uniref:transcriptional regulator n=1 Tax=Nocardioides euryhalodurans TaxID=2518370 RepID=UPI001FC9D4A0|nr:transcriptional regulator [Nocardioides euryhalodurans]